MSYTTAFIQNGATQLFTAAVTPPTALQVLPTFNAVVGSLNQFRVVNAGTETVFLGAGPSAAIAAANSAVVSTSGNAIPLVPGAVEVFSFPAPWFFTASTAANTSVIYITPGEGL
jgi:hypothetical protein